MKVLTRHLLFSVLFFLCYSVGNTQVTDSEGKTYKTVKYAGQTWMSENLSTAKFKNGDAISFAPNTQEWLSLCKSGKPAWCYPNFDENLGKSLGRLYNAYAVLDPRGLAPDGWRVASLTDWNKLIKIADPAADTACMDCSMSAKAGGPLKSLSTSQWKFDGVKPTATSGINISGGGMIDNKGEPFGELISGFYWTSSPEGPKKTFAIIFLGLSNTVRSVIRDNDFGYSVRCVKADEASAAPTTAQFTPKAGESYGTLATDAVIHSVSWDPKQNQYVAGGAKIIARPGWGWYTSTAVPFMLTFDDKLAPKDTLSLALSDNEKYHNIDQVFVFDNGYAFMGYPVLASTDFRLKTLWMSDGRSKNSNFRQLGSSGNYQVILSSPNDKKISFEKRDIFNPNAVAEASWSKSVESVSCLGLSEPDEAGKTMLAHFAFRKDGENPVWFWDSYDMVFDGENTRLENRQKSAPSKATLASGKEIDMYSFQGEMTITSNSKGQRVLIGTDRYSEGPSEDPSKRLHKYTVWMHVIDGSESGKTSVLAEGRCVKNSGTDMLIKPLGNGQFLIAETSANAIKKDDLKYYASAPFFIVSKEGTVITKGSLDLSKLTHPELTKMETIDRISVSWLVKPGNKVEAIVAFRGYNRDRDPATGGFKKTEDGTTISTTVYEKTLITRVKVN